MKLSVVIPAHDEEGSITPTVTAILDRLHAEGIEHEIVVVDDASTDSTAEVIHGLAEQHPSVRYLRSPYKNGFGFAVRAGLEVFTGDAVAIMMADGSDSPDDLIAYYPKLKLVTNRVVNLLIRGLFGHAYNDTTNAFKAYRREVIATVDPLLSHHFNLTVELPLKAVVRGHSYAIVPISWTGRKVGTSKLRLEEMGSRYLYIILMVFLEHHLSRGDYRRPEQASRNRRAWRAGRPSARIYDEAGAMRAASETPGDPPVTTGTRT